MLSFFTVISLCILLFGSLRHNFCHAMTKEFDEDFLKGINLEEIAAISVERLPFLKTILDSTVCADDIAELSGVPESSVNTIFRKFVF